jgi:hypothetical protein
MTKKNIQCSLAGLGRTTVLWAQGRHEFDGVVGSVRCGLKEDDNTAGPGTAWVLDTVGSRMVRGVQHRGLGEDNVVACSGTTSRAWGQGLHGQRRQWLGSGKMAARKDLHHGRERQ